MFGQATYLVFLLPWAGAVIAIQWLAGAPELRTRWRGILLATVLATLYLSTADHIALGDGIWEISPSRSIGVHPFGLPLEEALFFLLTNLMVSQSVALLLAPELSPRVVWRRLRERAGRVRRFLGAFAAAWPAGVAAASAAALLGSILAAAVGASAALNAPWQLVMVWTPVTVAAWLVETLGDLSRPLGLVGAFALFLLLGGIVGTLARLGGSSRLVALALAVPLGLWLGPNTLPLAAGILALGPLLAALVPDTAGVAQRGAGIRPSDGNSQAASADQGDATRRGSDISRRGLLTRVMPLFAALGLGVVWLAERRARGSQVERASSALFVPPEASPRSSDFYVAGQPPEVTPVDRFYVVSKNVEDPAPLLDVWRLMVRGRVEQPLSLDFSELTGLPRIDQYTTLRCVSNPVGWPLMSNGLWSGVPLAAVLGEAGVLADVRWVVARGIDGHYEDLSLAVALDSDTLVAYALNGSLLDRRHGYPARLVVPGRYGFKNVKWLDSLEAVADDRPGFWPGRGWTREGVMGTASRIDLIRRELDHVLVAGVALAGTRGISRVEVRAVGAAGPGEWHAAELHVPPLGRAAWVQWRVEIPAPKDGRVEARAVDGAGQPQIETPASPYPDGATGLHSIEVPT